MGGMVVAGLIETHTTNFLMLKTPQAEKPPSSRELMYIPYIYAIHIYIYILRKLGSIF